MATPMSLTTGVGLGALNGILVRGGEALPPHNYEGIMGLVKEAGWDAS